MYSTGFQISVSEELGERICALPGRRAHQNAIFERAVHLALTSAGWPQGERGEINVPASYWYVNVPHGHVGPIPDEARAKRVAESWQRGRCPATIARYPKGPALTNPI